MTEGIEKTWNEQLREWFKASGKRLSELCRETGIPRGTMKGYFEGKIRNFGRISYETRKKLYDLTNLSFLEYENLANTPRIDIGKSKKKKDADYGEAIGDDIRNISDTLHKTIDSLIEGLDKNLGISGGKKLKEKLLKAQRYSPNAFQRADSIVELIELLGFEVDYFRTASENERQILTDKLKANSDSFGYASQMLNILYSGKGLDSWMLLAQPPAKLLRVLREGERRGER